MTLRALTVMAYLLLPAAAMAQSTAKAPPLDDSLRAFIAAMNPLTERRPGALERRVVVVTFFASWCPPCRPEFGYLNEVRRTFPEREVAILAINLFEDFFSKDRAARMARFLDRTKPEFAVLQGPRDPEIEARFGGVDRIPTVYVYDRAGEPAYTFIHQAGAEKTHATAAELIPVLQGLVR